MDILHPLTTFHCKLLLNSYCYGTGTGDYSDLQLVSNNGKLYTYSSSGRLTCAPMTDLTSWTSVPLPAKVAYSTLATYCSQLVLVGGKRNWTKVLNEVWVLDADGTNWQQSLPPMPTCRSMAAAVNVGNSECLVVAGGHESLAQCTMDILIEGQWSSTRNFPRVTSRYNFQVSMTLHNGNLYIHGAHGRPCYYCKVESLIAGESHTQWEEVRLPGGHLISFGQNLLAMMETPSQIQAYSPLTQSWVCVADANDDVHMGSGTAISPAEMAVGVSILGHVYKITLQVSPYDPDSQFSTSALSRLEAAGIPVLTSLSLERKERLAAAIGARHSSSDEYDFGYDHLYQRDRRFDVASLVHQWVCQETTVPPTWRSLYGVLRELDLEELAVEIEDYLSCPRSLREQCTSVIMSALLQQRALEPDQLHVRLPDYVPPAVKRSLTRTFKAHTTHPPPTPRNPRKKKCKTPHTSSKKRRKH